MRDYIEHLSVKTKPLSGNLDMVSYINSNKTRSSHSDKDVNSGYMRLKIDPYNDLLFKPIHAAVERVDI